MNYVQREKLFDVLECSEKLAKIVSDKFESCSWDMAGEEFYIYHVDTAKSVPIEISVRVGKEKITLSVRKDVQDNDVEGAEEDMLELFADTPPLLAHEEIGIEPSSVMHNLNALGTIIFDKVQEVSAKY